MIVPKEACQRLGCYPEHINFTFGICSGLDATCRDAGGLVVTFGMDTLFMYILFLLLVIQLHMNVSSQLWIGSLQKWIIFWSLGPIALLLNVWVGAQVILGVCIIHAVDLPGKSEALIASWLGWRYLLHPLAAHWFTME